MVTRVRMPEANQVLIGDQLIEISKHAVQRYRERFCSHHGFSGARVELLSRLELVGQIQKEKPPWLLGRQELNAAFAVLDDGDLVLPLRQHYKGGGLMSAVTCLFAETPPVIASVPPAGRVLPQASIGDSVGDRDKSPDVATINHGRQTVRDNEELTTSIEQLGSEISGLELKAAELKAERAPIARELAWSEIKEILPTARSATFLIMAPPTPRSGNSYASLLRVEDADFNELYQGDKLVADPVDGQDIHLAKLIIPRLYDMREILWADLEIDLQFEDGFTLLETPDELVTRVTCSYRS